MNAPVRKPKPQHMPITLAELVIDLEARMEPDAGGEFLSAVELPGADWVRLVKAARDEEIEPTEEDQASPSGQKQPSATELEQTYERSAALLREANDLLRNRLEERDAEVATLRGMNRNVEANYLRYGEDLAIALGWGKLNGFADLLQAVRGYVMALDAELLAAGRECRGVPAPAVGPTAEERAKAAGRRLNGAGWKRSAKKARAERSIDACHHCGTSDDEDGLTCIKNSDEQPDGTFCLGCMERLRANPREWDRHSATPPPKKKAGLIPWDNAWDSNLLCARVQELGMTDLYKRMLGHTPHERRPAYKEAHELYLAGKLGAPPEPKKPKKAPPKAKAEKPAPAAPPTQIDLTEAIAEKSQAKPKQKGKLANKKFPLGTGVYERCTKCNRMQGAHDGNTCPPHAHGEHSDDYDSDGKLIVVAGARKEAAA